jgi:hypothetical protein
MTSDEGSDYDKVRFPFWCSRKFREEFKMFVSRKWPIYSHGVISAEIVLAMKWWMENDRRNAHTHKNTVISEAEDKPNFHRRTKGVKVNSEPIPTPTNAIVITNDGSSSDGGGDGKQSKSNFEDIFELANKMGVVVEDKHIQMAAKMRSDPEYMEQVKGDWIKRLEAKSKRQVVSEMKNKVSSRYKENLNNIRQIAAHVRNKDNVGIVADGSIGIAEGFVTKEDLEQAVRAVFGVRDSRMVKDRIKTLEADQMITWTELSWGYVRGKPRQSKKYGAYKINVM